MSVTVWVAGGPEPVSYQDVESDTQRVLTTWKVEDGCLRIYEFEWKVVNAVVRDFEPVGEKCFAAFNPTAWVRVEGSEHIGWD